MDIKHVPEENMFVAELDGETASVVYRRFDDYLDIIHTYVPTSIGGRGVAAALTKAAYQYALDNDLRCQATCSYAVKWLERHPEYLNPKK
ncbi:MAG: N-acetyltransferase [Bacteroides sp.]|nr:N-acetyltransferase [Bacteroides sp.]